MWFLATLSWVEAWERENVVLESRCWSVEAADVAKSISSVGNLTMKGNNHKGDTSIVLNRSWMEGKSGL